MEISQKEIMQKGIIEKETSLKIRLRSSPPKNYRYAPRSAHYSQCTDGVRVPTARPYSASHPLIRFSLYKVGTAQNAYFRPQTHSKHMTA